MCRLWRYLQECSGQPAADLQPHTGKLAARFQPLSKGNSSLGVFPVVGGGLQSGMVFGIRYRKINTAGTTAAQSHGTKV